MVLVRDPRMRFHLEPEVNIFRIQLDLYLIDIDLSYTVMVHGKPEGSSYTGLLLISYKVLLHVNDLLEWRKPSNFYRSLRNCEEDNSPPQIQRRRT